MSEDPAYMRERAAAVLKALGGLWSATDYAESRLIENYTEAELKAFLGEWIHVRKACNEIFDQIRAAHPDLPGWDPIQKDKPVDERLSDAEGTSA